MTTEFNPSLPPAISTTTKIRSWSVVAAAACCSAQGAFVPKVTTAEPMAALRTNSRLEFFFIVSIQSCQLKFGQTTHQVYRVF